MYHQGCIDAFRYPFPDLAAHAFLLTCQGAEEIFTGHYGTLICACYAASFISSLPVIINSGSERCFSSHKEYSS